MNLKQRTFAPESCIICGEPLKPGHKWVNYDNAGAEFIPLDASAEDHPESGLQAIGSGCARKLVKAGTIKAEWLTT